jgi:hypothetical protein
MNTIHRVIRRSETKMLIKDVDQYGTCIAIGEYNLPGRVIELILRSKSGGYYVVWDCQRMVGNKTKVLAGFCICNSPGKVFFVKQYHIYRQAS